MEWPLASCWLLCLSVSSKVGQGWPVCLGLAPLRLLEAALEEFQCFLLQDSFISIVSIRSSQKWELVPAEWL